MRIIVVGCGKIGRTLVQSLSSEGHDVIAMDSNKAIIDNITNTYDVSGINGLATDWEALSEANVGKSDIFVAVTGSDELNMLCCFMAKAMGAKKTIARIRNPQYNDKNLVRMQQFLNLSMQINPERSAARYVYNILRLPSAANVETFSSRNFEIIELKIKDDMPFLNQPIMDLRKKYDANFLVCCVFRGNKMYIPDGNFVLQGGDKIGVTASPQEMNKLMRKLGIMKRHARNVMIIGASRTAYYLAQMLTQSGTAVTIIEKSKARCDEYSQILPNVTVLHGDGASQDLLSNYGIATTDAFVSLTGMDEENILLSYYALSQNVNKVVTKINRPEFIPIAENLGLESIVSPWKTVSDIMVRYARAMQNSEGSNVERLYNVMGGKAEVLEFKISDEFKYINIPLKDIKFKSNVLIAGILRDRKAIIPSGDDYILPGDNVIVTAAGHRLYGISDIIQ
ncbi:MAG: Trk system potassium transporter TrkA [Clostridiales bacterium]|nr:Trk system potassium transporter TrkA [Clostridiales bacterium]